MMKRNLLLVVLSLFALLTMAQGKGKNYVEVLYFHGKQRCATCIAIEKYAREVVEKDFTEKNIRKYLNLGHTFGHALETLAGLGTVTHGDAVAWGIGRAVSLSAKLDFCKESYKDEVLHILSLYGWDVNPVPKIASGGGISERLIQIMHKDKKNKSDKISIVLQRGLTDTFTQEVEDGDILPVLR